MQLVDVTVYYLEMHTPAAQNLPPPRDGLTVLHVHQPSVAYYRWLYHHVGSAYHWLSRRKLADHELEAILRDPQNEVYVLHVDGSPAGFCELDRRQHPEMEIVQFGLMPEYHGVGLGTWFLRHTIQLACDAHVQRLWLHTCTLDHPAALPLYQKVGFTLYETQAIRREL